MNWAKKKPYDICVENDLARAAKEEARLAREIERLNTELANKDASLKRLEDELKQRTSAIISANLTLNEFRRATLEFTTLLTNAHTIGDGRFSAEQIQRWPSVLELTKVLRK